MGNVIGFGYLYTMHVIDYNRTKTTVPTTIAKGYSSDVATRRLLARSGKHPNDQRDLYSQEVFEDNIPALHHLAAARRFASDATCTVVSYNTYYSRVAKPNTKDVLNPSVTFQAAEAMLDAGVDVLCMQEVVFGEEKQGFGKDEYDFSFFAKEEFEQHGKAIAELKNRITPKGFTFVSAMADPSSMYRKRFGVAVVVNTEKFQIVKQQIIEQILAPVEKDVEGRSAALLHLKNKVTEKELFVVATHLTERIVGESGERQTLMMASLLQKLAVFKGNSEAPSVVAGDMNVNQFKDLPNTMANICEKSPFLSTTPENYPYKLLTAAGFKSVQSIASKHNQVLTSCWNNAVVDYVGADNGLEALFVGTLPPLFEGWRISDHSFPTAVYKL